MRGQARDYPSFPEIKAQIGYNPARFLDHEIKNASCTKDLTVESLIRGIQDVDTIRAWLTVEADLGRGRRGGPRQRVVKWLNRRQVQIENDETIPSATTTDSATGGSEAASDEELTEPVSDSRETASNGAATTASDPEPVPDPTCPICGDPLVPEEIAGQVGYWCCECHDFREPASEPPSPSVTAAPATGESATAVATDGGTPDPDTPPRCPDCHGELPEETVGDEDAHWCAYCGATKQVEGRA